MMPNIAVGSAQTDGKGDAVRLRPDRGRLKKKTNKRSRELLRKIEMRDAMRDMRT